MGIGQIYETMVDRYKLGQLIANQSSFLAVIIEEGIHSLKEYIINLIAKLILTFSSNT